MANNFFSQFNTGYVFELPQALLDKPTKERYMKIAKAVEKYGDQVIPIIAFGVSKNTSEDALSEENAWVATETEMINAPSFQIPVIKKLRANDTAIKLCKEGHMAVKLVSYQNEWGTNYKFEFVDR